MTETLTLKEALAQHTRPQKNKISEEKILAGLEAVLATPWEYEVEEWHAGIQKMLGVYIKTQFTRHYPILSGSIRQLTTNLLIPELPATDLENYRTSDVYTNISTTCPLFAFAEMGTKTWTWGGSAKAIRGGYQRDINVTIHATVPKPPREALAASATATATLSTIYARLFEHRTIGSYLAKNHPLQETGRFHILWRPEPDDLRIEARPPDKDPALVMQFCNEGYLIATWDIPREKPYKALLSEFMEDSTNNDDRGD
ncbi:hypothetical protein HY490_02915 [Candidatus Woesearchaeota archaeon]|nr:hypothetical protein [Candidatus Woesearchaeota archaeon]